MLALGGAAMATRNLWSPEVAVAQAPKTPTARVVPVEVAIAAKKSVPVRIARIAWCPVSHQNDGTSFQSSELGTASEALVIWMRNYDSNIVPVGGDYVDDVAPRYFNARKTTIYGGSSEVQRNVLAKAMLGL